MKIAIVTTHMNMGGIRSSLLNLLNYLSKKNVMIDLYVLTGNRNDIETQVKKYAVHKVEVIPHTDTYYTVLSEQNSFIKKFEKMYLGLSARLIGREKTLHRCIDLFSPKEEYDIAISYSNGIWTHGSRGFTGGCEFLVTDKIKAKRKIAWIHSNPVNLGFTNEICRRIYDPFDKIVNVSDGCKQIYDEICPEHREKSIVVHNLCNTERVKKLAAGGNPYNNQKIKLVTVARLDNKSKRLDRIAEVCQMLKKDGMDFEWHLVGDGNDRELIENLVRQEDIQDNLILDGRQENPYIYMKYADIYVCTSDYEAFPMVIKEAQTVGIPTVTTPIPSAKELVTDAVDGFISADFSTQGIYEKLKYLMAHTEKVDEMKEYMQAHKNQYGDIYDEIERCLKG